MGSCRPPTARSTSARRPLIRLLLAVWILSCGTYRTETERQHCAAPCASTPASLGTRIPDQRSRRPYETVSPRRPVCFERNQGQFDRELVYVARARHYNVLLTRHGPLLQFAPHPTPRGAARTGACGDQSTHWLRMVFEGGHLQHPCAADRLRRFTSYYPNRDPSSWTLNVPNYRRAGYRELYPGIDLWFYGREQQLEFDLVLRPGGCVDAVRLRFEGADSLRTTPDGGVTIACGRDAVRLEPPYVYQLDDAGRRRRVPAHYRLAGRHLAFAVGPHDATRPLVIDPVVTYTTYFGGSSWDSINDLAVDAAGRLYVLGSTASVDLPGTTARSSPNEVAFLSRLSRNATTIDYTVYLGDDTTAAAIATGPGGHLFVTGTGFSAQLPTTTGSYAPTRTAARTPLPYLLCLSQDAQLVFGTWLPVPGEGFGIDVAVTSSGQPWLLINDNPSADASASACSGSAPTTGACLLALLRADGSAQLACTRIDGDGYEEGSRLGLDSAGNVYVSGQTDSSALFGSPTAGVLTPFVASFDTQGTLRYGLVLGGTNDFGISTGMAVRATGEVLVTGSTTSTSLPTTPDARQTSFDGLAGTANGFLWIVSPGGTTRYLSYFTLGPTVGTDVHTLQFDTSANRLALLGVETEPAPNLPSGMRMRAYVATLDLTTLPPGPPTVTFLTPSTDAASGSFPVAAASDGGNGLYVGGSTSDAVNFPVTSDAAQCDFGGQADGFVFHLSDNQPAGTIVGPGGCSRTGDSVPPTPQPTPTTESPGTPSRQFFYLDPAYCQDIVAGPGASGGLGWLPDGRMVLRMDEQILVFGLVQDQIVHGTPVRSRTIHDVPGLGFGIGLTTGTDGYLYANTDAGVARIDPVDWSATHYAGSAVGGLGIATAPNGNLIHVGHDPNDPAARDRIWRLDPATGSDVPLHDPGTFVDGIAVAPTGEIFLALLGDNAIRVLAPDGTLIQTVALEPKGPQGFDGPDGIAFGAGAVFTNNTDGSISRLEFSQSGYRGPATETIVASGGAYGDFAAVGPDGSLYVTQIAMTDPSLVPDSGFADLAITWDDGTRTYTPDFVAPDQAITELQAVIVRISSAADGCAGGFTPPPGVRPNTPPVATAGPDRTLEATGPWTPVSLDGSASFDPDGDALTFTWSFAQGGAQGPNPTVALPVGTTVITLTVDDGNGATASDEVVITIRDTTPPVVLPPPDRTVEAHGLLTPVDLGAATATDLVDGSVPATPDTRGPFAVGSHEVVWSATDRHGNTGYGTQTITVHNSPPIARAAVHYTQPTCYAPRYQVLLDATASTDINSTPTYDDIADYRWSIDGRVLGSGAVLETWFGLGTHAVELLVTDRHGASNRDTVTFEILPPPLSELSIRRLTVRWPKPRPRNDDSERGRRHALHERHSVRDTADSGADSETTNDRASLDVAGPIALPCGTSLFDTRPTARVDIALGEGALHLNVPLSFATHGNDTVTWQAATRLANGDRVRATIRWHAAHYTTTLGTSFTIDLRRAQTGTIVRLHALRKATAPLRITVDGYVLQLDRRRRWILPEGVALRHEPRRSERRRSRHRDPDRSEPFDPSLARAGARHSHAELEELEVWIPIPLQPGVAVTLEGVENASVRVGALQPAHGEYRVHAAFDPGVSSARSLAARFALRWELGIEAFPGHRVLGPADGLEVREHTWRFDATERERADHEGASDSDGERR
ncbi:MAG: HYR domain-containing protein [Planctomycetota bacterium]|nr:MAG: HYR domain-containing protein [Planctomycetota bacterium]